MISRKKIQAFVDQVVQRFHPLKVILFGSYAYGRPTRDSDVDLLVIMPHAGPSAQTATRIRLACPRSFPMDLIVRKPSELAAASAWATRSSRRSHRRESCCMKFTTREWVDKAEADYAAPKAKTILNATKRNRGLIRCGLKP